MTSRPPSFGAEVERDGDVVVLRVFGDLDLANHPTFERCLARVRRSTAGQVTIDLSGLNFIDSSGLRALVHACTSSDGDARIKLLRGSGAVERVFALTGLDARLPFLD